MADISSKGVRTLALASIAGGAGGIASATAIALVQGMVADDAFPALAGLGIRIGGVAGVILGIAAVMAGVLAARLGRTYEPAALLTMVGFGVVVGLVAATGAYALSLLLVVFSAFVAFAVRVGTEPD